MRAFVTILILVIVIAFVYINQSDLGIASNAYIVEGLTKIRNMFSDDSSPNNADNKTTVFIHKDKDGNWAFSDKHNPEDSDARQIDYYSNTNVIPALRKELLEKQKSNTASRQASKNNPSSKEPEAESKFNHLTDIVNDARSIEGKLQLRKEKQDQITNQQ